MTGRNEKLALKGAFMGTLLTLASASVSAGERAACEASSGEQRVALVELFTSEGCSSCPPADRWLSKQIADASVNYLAFHVDYWDYIGWKDRFASPDFSARQRQRVAARGERTMYTPQVMVGEQVRVSWNNPRAVQAAVRAGPELPGVGLSLRLRPDADGWSIGIGAALVDPSESEASLWVAEYLDGQTSLVGAGENRGVTLQHDRVVIRLSGPWRLGSKPFSKLIKAPASGQNWGVMAFVQAADGRTLQSLNLPASTCSAGAAVAAEKLGTGH